MLISPTIGISGSCSVRTRPLKVIYSTKCTGISQYPKCKQKFLSLIVFDKREMPSLNILSSFVKKFSQFCLYSHDHLTVYGLKFYSLWFVYSIFPGKEQETIMFRRSSSPSFGRPSPLLTPQLEHTQEYRYLLKSKQTEHYTLISSKSNFMLESWFCGQEQLLHKRKDRVRIPRTHEKVTCGQAC